MAGRATLDHVLGKLVLNKQGVGGEDSVVEMKGLRQGLGQGSACPDHFTDSRA